MLLRYRLLSLGPPPGTGTEGKPWFAAADPTVTEDTLIAATERRVSSVTVGKLSAARTRACPIAADRECWPRVTVSVEPTFPPYGLSAADGTLPSVPGEDNDE